MAGHGHHPGSARVFVVAAETSVWSALRVAATGDADALVALSPPDFHNDGGLANVRAATLPKLLLVGAGDEGRLEAVRSLFRCCSGWTVLSTLPTREQGTNLLVGTWGRQAREQIAAFLHDYQAVGTGSS